MTNHFTSIGFALDSNEEFADVLRRASDEGESIPAERGRYVCWPVDSAAQLWIQVNEENSLTGMNPHFAGRALMQVRLGSRLERDAANSLEGGLHGWADPSPDGDDGAYPIVFDLPDFALTAALTFPVIADVQLAAFAHSCVAHASEEAFHATQTSEPRFAAQSFIPSGLFSASGAPEEPPPVHAMFNGIVAETALLTNTATGRQFRWALVSTYGGEIDVVATPDEVEGEIVVGGVVEVSGWLSGRIVTAH